ncbi:hypothetical protein ACLK1T_13545 [Escherichia coli]
MADLDLTADGILKADSERADQKNLPSSRGLQKSLCDVPALALAEDPTVRN